MKIQGTEGWPVPPSVDEGSEAPHLQPMCVGEALGQQGKEMGEEVSRLHGLMDDEMESNPSFSVATREAWGTSRVSADHGRGWKPKMR